ncbi:hypothetical protein FOA43_000256 [Brettanomyces nanus]|uniref:non-specific serine/threonine protein kinase n=1 Tax=Eeniella nana TaxID=13502 RepID=A0A875RYF8_EENNA|nr:uncharacterized protein FOA43_000256 [Brettanomyces nanus]QPG72952.1 hypothetical protein FOA43_000256 [Brettanomyces nanus]
MLSTASPIIGDASTATLMASAVKTTTTNTNSAAPSFSGSSGRSAVSAKRRGPREVRFGVYVLGATLGEGEFGKVKLGWRKDNQQPSQAAIKLIRRDTIPHGSEKESKIHREINALKRLRHPNIVRLVEVLQNDKYIGIVLEYASGGELFDYILEHRYLKESMACRLFAQLVSGVDYMHSKGLVHRDLKLENLLLDKHKNIIISDFGFVNSFHTNDLMRTSCGSPCYAAPELVVSNQPYQGAKVDVWSCGVILYAMLAGYLPYDDDPQNPDGENIARLYHYITTSSLTFPEYITPTPRDLLRKIIVADPRHRISLHQVRAHPWLAPHAPFLSVTPEEWDRNYKAARMLFSQSDKAHRRYSLMENHTSASLMLNKHSIKSYSTHNVSQALYSNPAAPQTSRTVAISASTSSFELKAGDNNSSSNTNSIAVNISIPSNTVASSPYETYRASHHRRNGSSASIALQAVVEADNAEHSRRNSLSDVSITNIVHSNLPSARSRPFQRPTTFAATSQETPSASFVPLDTLIGTTETQVNSGIETIVEGTENSLPFTTVSSRPPRTSSKLNRPRPTSYHPGLISSSHVSAHDFAFLMPSSRMDTSSVGDISRYRERSSATNSRSSSPIKDSQSKRNSWCQPKISEPALDMSLANGVLTKLSEPSRSVVPVEQNYINSSYEKRRSIALDSLSNAMENLSVSSDIPKEEVKREPEEKPPEGCPEHSERAKNTMEISADSSQHTRHHHRHHQKNIENTATNGVGRVITSSSEKENHISLSTSVTNKFKRFSLLSFYTKDSIYETATSTLKKRSSYAGGNSSHAKHSRTSSRTASRTSRRPLEPSNLLPMTAEESVENSANNSRVASNSSNKPHTREPSTAKRVMDFFRRRSIRI